MVKIGIYRYTRNPMYLAGLVGQIGLAFVINTWWFIIFLPLTYIGLRYIIIAGEEKYLLSKFGEEYKQYCSQTPRWL